MSGKGHTEHVLSAKFQDRDEERINYLTLHSQQVTGDSFYKCAVYFLIPLSGISDNRQLCDFDSLRSAASDP